VPHNHIKDVNVLPTSHLKVEFYRWMPQHALHEGYVGGIHLLAYKNNKKNKDEMMKKTHKKALNFLILKASK
jgi:hypothetical protein